jgi:sulfur carrier protein
MKLLINGSPKEVAGGPWSLPELLKVEKVSDPDYVTVELNGEIVRREAFPATQVKEGDALEFLYFMGGGAAPWES